MSALKRRLRKLSQHEVAKLMGNASFVFVCRVIGAALVLIMQIMLARWMGVEQLGIYVYVSAWLILMAAVVGLGFPNAVFRFIGKGLAEANENLVVSFSRRGGEVILISSLLTITISFLLINEINSLVSPDKQSTFLIALFAVPLFALMRWYSGVANALSCYRLAFLPMLIMRPLLLLLAVGTLWFIGEGLSSDIVMLTHFGVMLIILIIQFYLVNRVLHYRFPNAIRSENKTWSWLRTSIPLLITGLFTKNFLELNLIIVGIYLGADQIAIFNATFRIAFLIAFGIYAMDSITAPKVAEMYAAGNLKSLQRIVLRSTKIKFFGSGIGVIGLALFGKQILALFGDDFVVGYEALIILSVSQVVVAGFGAGPQLLNVSGNQNRCLNATIYSTILMFGLHTLFIPRFGLNGGAIVVLLVVCIKSLWVNMIVVRRLSIFPTIVSFRRCFNKV